MGCQPASILLLLAIYLLLQPTVVSGACCTRGQPLYTGDTIYMSSTYGFPLSFLTCSDGPCSGPSYDYRASSFESGDPTQCCDSQNLGETGTQQGNPSSYYNPQQNSAGYWLGSAGPSYNQGSSIPGTSRTCNPNLPVVTCGIKGVLSETCQSLRTANALCALNTMYDANNNAKTTTTAGFQSTCCRPTTCADFKGSKLCLFPLTAYNDAANSTTTTILTFQQDCCKTRTCDDIKSDVQCNAGTKYAQSSAALFVIDFQQQCCEPSTCADITGSCLTGYIAKPVTTILSALADYSTDCCTPMPPSCGNTVPTLLPAVKFDCSASLLNLLGIWRYDDSKADQTPSQVNCCKQSTCGSLLLDDKLSCDAGFKYCGDDTLKPNNFKTDCCVPNTCADIAGSCGIGYIAKPLTTVLGAINVNFTSDCCTPIGATCGNTLPLLLLPIAYDCSKISPGVWTYDSTKSGLTPSDVNCCKTRKCGELVMSGSTCTTGSTYTGAGTQDVTTGFQQDCCKAVQPTCSNTVPATPGVKYDCSTQTPGAWIYDSAKDSSSPPDCCKSYTCADAAGSCGTGYIAKPLTTILGAISVNFTTDCCTPIGATCGNTLPLLLLPIAYDCSSISPGVWTYDSTKSGLTPSSVNCCKTRKCGELVMSGSTCTTGSTYTGAGTQNVTTGFQQDCCQAVPPTCSNTVPATPGVKYDCSTQTPGAWIYDSAKDSSSPPDCCKRLSCTAAVTASPSTYTCPTTYTFIGTNTTLFTNFTADCCQKTPTATCSTLKTQNATCGTNRIYDSLKNSTLSTSSSYDTDCCKAATCTDAKTAGSTCATNTTYMSSNNNTKIVNNFTTDCCTTKCRFSSSASGGKCPVFSWADVSSSFRLTAGSVQGKVNITFTNGFVYSTSCGSPVSWLTIANCGTCQKVNSASLGTAFTELKDVDCGSTIYVIAYDGSYKVTYGNCLRPDSITLDVCINLNLLSGISLLSSACYTSSTASSYGACKWPLTVQCPSSLQLNAGISISL